jgi:hypothetical protein
LLSGSFTTGTLSCSLFCSCHFVFVVFLLC